MTDHSHRFVSFPDVKTDLARSGRWQTGEHIAGSRVLFQSATEPLLVGGAIEGKKIVQITSGQQHNIALDADGYCYGWGFGGELLSA